MRHTGNRIVGSNPTLSAINFHIQPVQPHRTEFSGSDGRFYAAIAMHNEITDQGTRARMRSGNPSPIISILDMDHSRLAKANGLAAGHRGM
jgi:hypothetical protein